MIDIGHGSSDNHRLDTTQGLASISIPFNSSYLLSLPSTVLLLISLQAN